MTTGCKQKETVAEIKTNLGDIRIELYADKTPETVKNFVEIANAGKYDNTIFHRVMDGFMIQGGNFEHKEGGGGYSYKGPGTYLEDEIVKSLTHKRGVISMANRGPNTGGSQFFIVQAEDGAHWLNGGHAVFGHVIEGMDVVDKIAKMPVDDDNLPLQEIIIETIKIN